MTENRKFKGFWFLPSNPDIKVPGILYYDIDKEIRLELIGSFHKDLITLLQSEKGKTITIQGITNKHQEISVFNCFQTYSKWNFSSSFGIVEYKGNSIVIGKHFLENQSVFNSIKLSFNNLHFWYGKNIISHKIHFSKNNNATELEFLLPKLYQENETFTIEENITLKLINRAGFKTLESPKGYQLNEDVFIEIKSLNNKKSILFFMNKVKLLEDFFTLINLDNVSINSLNLFDNDNFQQMKNGKKNVHQIEILKVHEIIKEKNYNLLFRFSDVSSFLPSILNKWFNLGESFIPIRNHLISSIKKKKTFTSLDFLIIVQALEGYHRRFINNKDLNLKNRIESLILYFKDVKKVKISDKEVTFTVKSRGYYSHFYENDSNVLYGIDLYNLTMKLRILLICCVLDLTGFEKNIINSLVESNQKL